MESQPPSGGCVLKRYKGFGFSNVIGQPPSGGCVLKPEPLFRQRRRKSPAAFRRLCVETRESEHLCHAI
mgnify:FL=1